MSEPFHEPWKGRNKILLSIDIGITNSGVSFAYLENGATQTLCPVTEWPGQALTMNGTIPNMIWYNASNEAVAFGAEAQSFLIEEQAKDKGWFLAKNFKAHLYPEGTFPQQTPGISALPFGVSLRKVYSDFLGYLLKHTQSYFEDRIIDGAQIWESYKSALELVMSHPNGWGAREQAFLREVAVSAGYTTSDMAPSSIRFITDLEASVQSCLFHATLTKKLKVGDVLLLCDAGATTTNISLHSIDSISPALKMHTYSSECLIGGATSVDVAAEKYMQQAMVKAGISPEDANEFTRAGIDDFKNRVKLAFNDETKEYLVQISNARFNNPTLKTRLGRMALPGSVVKSFFAEYINTIGQSVGQAIDWLTGRATNVSYILLAGRFGDSYCLLRAINELYGGRGYPIIAPASSSSYRAVVNGALILDAAMNNGPCPRRSIGIETSCGNWLAVAPKGSIINLGTEIKKPISLKYPTPRPNFSPFELKFLTYTNEGEVTRTRDTKGLLLAGFSKWFTLTTKLDLLSEAVVQRLGANNVVHWQLNFNVCIRFEEKGLEAYLEWEEEGGTQTSAATIRPDFEF
ncbi:hypothetical protein RSOLAG22IIIB_11196 [Rhizoctonia solani]|uniref:Uncharacterized protein n=1 Tax=Rhizoctonia solani TaxID=456999 RepID=A0A0K6G7D7_9AGAM|nr:hypothetical protein RSOLAG22IIIB_11196 [Rhizoctonia solani]